jgi:anti-anti-sigma regulatory factor
VRMNSANKKYLKQASKQAKLRHTIFVWSSVGTAIAELFSVQQSLQVKLKTFHLLWKCPQMWRKWRNNI